MITFTHNTAENVIIFCTHDGLVSGKVKDLRSTITTQIHLLLSLSYAYKYNFHFNGHFQIRCI